MVSADNSLMVLILDGLKDIRQEIRSLRNENAEFRLEVRQEIKDFKTEVKQDIANFKAETNARFDRLEAQVSVMQNDITGLKHDVSNLYTWNYWTLSIILALAAMPHVVAGIKSLFGAIADGISLIAGAFRRSK